MCDDCENQFIHLIYFTMPVARITTAEDGTPKVFKTIQEMNNPKIKVVSEGEHEQFVNNAVYKFLGFVEATLTDSSGKDHTYPALYFENTATHEKLPLSFNSYRRNELNYIPQTPELVEAPANMVQSFSENLEVVAIKKLYATKNGYPRFKVFFVPKN